MEGSEEISSPLRLSMMTYVQLLERIKDAEADLRPADKTFFGSIADDLLASARETFSLLTDTSLAAEARAKTAGVLNSMLIDFASDPENLLPSDSMGEGNSRVERLLNASSISQDERAEYLERFRRIDSMLSDLLAVSENDGSTDSEFLARLKRELDTQEQR